MTEEKTKEKEIRSLEEEIKYLDELIELGKNIKNWRRKYNGPLRKYYGGSLKDVALTLRIKIKKPFFSQEVKEYYLGVDYNPNKMIGYSINKKNPNFEKIEELYKHILQNIKDSKGNEQKNAIKKLKDLAKEIRLDKEIK